MAGAQLGQSLLRSVSMIDDDTLQELQDKSTAAFSAKVLADSVNPWGDRLTTFELVFPRMLLPELATHRLFSKNTASSRAIPLDKTIEAVRENPFIPFHWGKNQSGMQAHEELSGSEELDCRWYWWRGAMDAVAIAATLRTAGLHKQIANRVLEPYLFTTLILSCTSFKHFEILRTNEMAEPHFQYLAKLMVSARSQSIPEALKPGEWHLPLVYDEDREVLGLDALKKVSVARCAAVSYVRHGERKEYEKDFALYDRLVTGGHWSPTEHVATPISTWDKYNNGLEANFKGWKQHRKEFETEFVPDEKYEGPTRNRC